MNNIPAVNEFKEMKNKESLQYKKELLYNALDKLIPILKDDPIYNPWNTDKLYSEMTAEEKQVWGDQVWERHLEETKRLQEKYKPAMIVDNERLRAEIEMLREERDGWREAAYSLGEAIPASWEELQPPAAQLERERDDLKEALTQILEQLGDDVDLYSSDDMVDICSEIANIARKTLKHE